MAEDLANNLQGPSGSILRDALTIGLNKQHMVQDFAPSHLRASLARSDANRQTFKGLRDRAAASISNDVNRERFALRKTAAQLSQAETASQGPPTSFASAIGQAARRGRARYGIVNRGDKAIANQNLRDRITFAKAGIQREGSLQTMMQQLANIREGVNVGVSDANASIAASNAALAGGAIGGITGFLSNQNNRDWLKGIFSKPSTPTGAMSPVPQTNTGGLTVFGDPET